MKKQAYNPFLPISEYIPDGEPHIFGDRVYIYGSHDAEGGYTFCMRDYVTYSAPVDDLSDWRYEGVIYRADQDPQYGNPPHVDGRGLRLRRICGTHQRGGCRYAGRTV